MEYGLEKEIFRYNYNKVFPDTRPGSRLVSAITERSSEQ